MQSKILEAKGTATESYKPVYIPSEKYSKVTRGRNVFFATCIIGVSVFFTVSMIPYGLMNRSVRRIYHTYCRGKVLDLTPKIADANDVALYEMSKAVRVEFLVKERIVDDGRYKIDDTLSEALQEERRKAMTLDFMVKNDHNWVGSTVTFDLVEEKETRMPDFQKYDTVVIRNELLNRSKSEARDVLNSAAVYVGKDGYVLLMDFGSPSWPPLRSLTRWFHTKTKSSLHLTHDYDKWIKDDNRYIVVEKRRCLLGLHYALALRLKT